MLTCPTNDPKATERFKRNALIRVFLLAIHEERSEVQASGSGGGPR